MRPGDAGAVEAARQVDVDDVEASGAEREVRRLAVDHDLVAALGGADERRVGDRRPRPAARHVDDQLLLGDVRGARLADRPAPQDQPRHAAATSSTSARTTSSIPSSAATLTRSVGSWLRSVPLARLVHGKPWASSALASEPPPVRIRRGS